MSSGSRNGINYIYAPAVDGPLLSLNYTQFEILKSKPSSTSPASAILAWAADANVVGMQIYRVNGYLKLEMDGSRYRVSWKF